MIKEGKWGRIRNKGERARMNGEKIDGARYKKAVTFTDIM